MNSKDYGIPQNRERVFAVSIRKDLNLKFEFPEKIPLEKKLFDILEPEVDAKFYIPQEKAEKLLTYLVGKEISNTTKVAVKEAVKKGYSIAQVGDSINFEQPNSKTRRGRVGKQIAQTITTSPHQAVIQPIIVSKQGTVLEKITDIACTLTARDYKGFGNQGMNGVMEFPCIGASRGRNPENPSDRTVGSPTVQRLEINKNDISNTITSVTKDNLVIERIVQVGNINFTSRSNGNPQDGRVYSEYGVAPTLRAHTGPLVLNDFRIRRLTPLECWRLMGFDDESFYKAKNSGVSDTQLYKQAGNSVVVDVLEKIFEKLLRSV